MKKIIYVSILLLWFYVIVGCETTTEIPTTEPTTKPTDQSEILAVIPTNGQPTRPIIGNEPTTGQTPTNSPQNPTPTPQNPPQNPQPPTPQNPPQNSQVQITQTNDSYYQNAQTALRNRKTLQSRANEAKNVIVFVSDGAGPAIVTATRIYDGQRKGMLGEENNLSFENFPHVAITKTYNDNSQTPDSAGTATALFTGVKTKQGVIGVAKEAKRGVCKDALEHPVTNIIELAESIGLSTGIVSTSRITHATPAATFAHSADRNWESSAPSGCKDIAAQLVDFPVGDGIDVILGGGRKHFLPKSVKDAEDQKSGARGDNRNLTREWQGDYIWNKKQFNQLRKGSDNVLGLFNNDHLEYEYDRIREHGSVAQADEPSLVEMTAKAIELLSDNPSGYFLMVEAGRVDHAAHDGNAFNMLNENVVFSKAVQKAIESVDLSNTLIIVTADHGHTVSLSGYAQRGNNILGLVRGLNAQGNPVSFPSLALDGKPYTVINFANGKGSSKRTNLTEQQVTSPNYVQQALIPLSSGTHSGMDVMTYSTGPMSHLLGGVIEQNYIFHVISEALNLSTKRN